MNFSFSQQYQFNQSIFIILRDLIHQKTGLYYDEQKRQILGDKIIPRLIARNLDSFLDYYYLLKYDEHTSSTEWLELINVLSVSETFFWRELDQIEALVKIIIPDYLHKCSLGQEGYITPTFSNPLKIWCAACSTGEEPISIIIALKEAGLLNQIPLKIYASDASTRALKIAQTGLYRDHSFRNLPLNLKQKYFTKKDDLWQICPDIHRYIHWHRANLLNPSDIEPFTDARFIFCRNVFIYFSASAIVETINLFYEAMPSPAYLLIGTAESLLQYKSKFQFKKIGNAFVYVKD